MAQVGDWANDLAAAVMLLTRAPVERLGLHPPPSAFTRGVWAYPLVGAAVGAAGAAVIAVASHLALPPGIGAVAALAAMALLTGALHEDGLADAADGLGGGATRDRKLEIMRDSRIGGYGALALILTVLIRVFALAAMPGAGRSASALIAAGALGRGAILIPILLLPPARRDGLAATLASSRTPSLIGLALAAAIALPLVPPAAIAIAAIAALAVTRIARHQIGGHTGDLLGATCVIVECAVLAALSAG